MKKSKRQSLDDVFGQDEEVVEEPKKTRKKTTTKKNKKDVDEGMNVIPDNIDSEMGVEPVDPPDENMGVEPVEPPDEDMGVIPDSDIQRPKPEISTDPIDPDMGVLPPDGSHLPTTPDLNPPEVDPGYLEEDDTKIEDLFNGSGVVEWNIGSGIGEKTEYKLPEELKSNIQDYACDSNANMANIALNNISGVKLIGTYFNIRGDRHEAVVSESVTIDGAMQAYNIILNSVLFATKALDETKYEEMTLEVILAMGIVPRVNDYFCFASVNKSLLFFTVKEIERIGYSSREVHKLTLQYQFNSETSMDKIEDLMSKVVETLYYDHNAQTLGEQSLLSPEDLALKDELGNLMEEMKDFYDDMFLDPDYGIYNLYSRNNGLDLHIPYIVYDPYVAQFHQSLICFGDNVYSMGNYTPDIKIQGRELNFFNAIRRKESVNVKMLHRHYGAGEVERRRIDAFLRNILLIKGSMVITEHKTNCYEPLPHMQCLLKRDYEKELSMYPLHYKSPEDLSYIFSQSFYEGDMKAMTPFEKAIVKLLDKQPIDIKDYLPYFKTYRVWSVYEQFYIIPIMIYIARKVRKGITRFK